MEKEKKVESMEPEFEMGAITKWALSRDQKRYDRKVAKAEAKAAKAAKVEQEDGKHELVKKICTIGGVVVGGAGIVLGTAVAIASKIARKSDEEEVIYLDSVDQVESEEPDSTETEE